MTMTDKTKAELEALIAEAALRAHIAKENGHD